MEGATLDRSREQVHPLTPFNPSLDLAGGEALTAFTKLMSSIVTSSIWTEDDDTLRVWIALLAMADAEGHVDGSIPGFASLCRMSVGRMQKALGKLQAPDKFSRSPQHEGRRIMPEKGGWRILNYLAVREGTRQMDAEGYAYFIQAGESGPVKIAFSANPWARHTALQQAAPDETYFLRGAIKGTRRLLEDLHARFAKQRIDREWFKASPELLEVAGSGSALLPVATPVPTVATTNYIQRQKQREEVEEERTPPTTLKESDTQVEPLARLGPADGPGVLVLTAVEPSKVRTEDVRRIFDHWRQACQHPDAKLLRDREMKIRARLKDGYAPEFIMEAIDACSRSEFHMGENDRSTRYDDLTLICRSGSKLEWFHDMGTESAKPKTREDKAKLAERARYEATKRRIAEARGRA